MKLLVEPTNNNVELDKLIAYAHPHDAGADVYMQEDIVLNTGKNIIPLGFKLVLPAGVMGLIFPRSSMMGESLRFDSAPIDPGYSGEWNLVIWNSGKPININKHSRICQIVLVPYIQADFVSELTNLRGNGGLGSTGK